MDVIGSVRVKSGRDYICDYCESKIFKSEEYTRDTIASNGTVYVWRSCDYCEALIDDMFKSFDYPDGASDADFREYLEHFEIKFERRL